VVWKHARIGASGRGGLSVRRSISVFGIASSDRLLSDPCRQIANSANSARGDSTSAITSFGRSWEIIIPSAARGRLRRAALHSIY
jgi:hypothetical protein